MSLSATLFKKFVPTGIRKAIIRKRILNYYAAAPALQQDPEWREVAERMKDHPLEIFPYDFTDRYREDDIDVLLDNASGMHYVMQDGRKLFFKRSWKPDKIRRSYNMLRKEQDPASPHYYLAPGFQVEEGEILADIGCAEGNFSLAMIEKVKKLYLFECDPGWLEALQKTFEPWKDKVEIVARFVSDRNDDTHIKGDDYFRDKTLTFLKMDVDGGERPLLQGLKDTLANVKPLKIALCTYHRQEDEGEFTAYFQKLGFTVGHSDRYMIFYLDKLIGPPYLRRGLIRAVR